jgi:hypothetical protein
MRRNPFDREPMSRSFVRLVALATLALFLLAQPWVVCLPLCLVQGHAGGAMAAAHHRSHVMPCHTGNVVRSEVPASGSLGIMLPAQCAPALPSLPVVTLPIAPPAAVFLQQVPAADPPPPRSA